MKSREGSRRAKDIRATEQEFIWHDRLPAGHMSVIAGSPGAGKSTLGYRIAADANVPTLFVTSEEVDRSVWRPRLTAAGVDPAKAWHHPEVRFSKDPTDLAYLGDLVRLYGLRLIVVDPIQNHLGVHVSHDQAVRAAFDPYLELIEDARIALVLEAHVLRRVNPNADPLLAIPAGLGGWAKTAYLFAKDPTLGSDPDLRILATAKYNFGKWPESRRFEFSTTKLRVQGVSGGRVTREYGYWIDRGETRISAKMLLLTLSPETKDRKWDRVALLLGQLLRDGPVPVSEIRLAIEQEDPPISWRTVERVKSEMEIEEEDDPSDKRRKFWRLVGESAVTMASATEAEDEVEVEEIDLDVPDTLPESWESNDDDDESEP